MASLALIASASLATHPSSNQKQRRYYASALSRFAMHKSVWSCQHNRSKLEKRVVCTVAKEKNVLEQAKVRLEVGPQRENFPGGTKVNTGPQNLIGTPSLIGAHAVKSFFVGWV